MVELWVCFAVVENCPLSDPFRKLTQGLRYVGDAASTKIGMITYVFQGRPDPTSQIRWAHFMNFETTHTVHHWVVSQLFQTRESIRLPKYM